MIAGSESWLSFDELDAGSAEFDTLVAETPEVDPFCTSSDWVVPARGAFAPEARPLVGKVDGGWIALVMRRLAGGHRVACPLEAVWGLASPFVGRDPAPLVARSLDLLRRGSPRGALDALVLCGLADGGRAEQALRAHAGDLRLELGPDMGRVVASLEGGVDGYWSRRSAKFRATTRRARRQAAAAGVVYEHHFAIREEAELWPVWRRILRIERASRKAAIGGGMAVPEMRRFYELMLPRLAQRGALRVIFARRGDDDLAFVFGGIWGGVYRGLQVSFDDRFAAESPGVLVHLEMIEALCLEGVAGYDLGTDMEYKRRWGEPSLTTRTWFVARAGS